MSSNTSMLENNILNITNLSSPSTLPHVFTKSTQITPRQPSSKESFGVCHGITATDCVMFGEYAVMWSDCAITVSRPSSSSGAHEHTEILRTSSTPLTSLGKDENTVHVFTFSSTLMAVCGLDSSHFIAYTYNHCHVFSIHSHASTTLPRVATNDRLVESTIGETVDVTLLYMFNVVSDPKYLPRLSSALHLLDVVEEEYVDKNNRYDDNSNDYEDNRDNSSYVLRIYHILLCAGHKVLGINVSILSRPENSETQFPDVFPAPRVTSSSCLICRLDNALTDTTPHITSVRIADAHMREEKDKEEEEDVHREGEKMKDGETGRQDSGRCSLSRLVWRCFVAQGSSIYSFELQHQPNSTFTPLPPTPHQEPIATTTTLPPLSTSTSASSSSASAGFGAAVSITASSSSRSLLHRDCTHTHTMSSQGYKTAPVPSVASLLLTHPHTPRSLAPVIFSLLLLSHTPLLLHALVARTDVKDDERASVCLQLCEFEFTKTNTLVERSCTPIPPPPSSQLSSLPSGLSSSLSASAAHPLSSLSTSTAIAAAIDASVEEAVTSAQRLSLDGPWPAAAWAASDLFEVLSHVPVSNVSRMETNIRRRDHTRATSNDSKRDTRGIAATATDNADDNDSIADDMATSRSSRLASIVSLSFCGQSYAVCVESGLHDHQEPILTFLAVSGCVVGAEAEDRMAEVYHHVSTDDENLYVSNDNGWKHAEKPQSSSSGTSALRESGNKVFPVSRAWLRHQRSLSLTLRLSVLHTSKTTGNTGHSGISATVPNIFDPDHTSPSSIPSSLPPISSSLSVYTYTAPLLLFLSLPASLPSRILAASTHTDFSRSTPTLTDLAFPQHYPSTSTLTSPPNTDTNSTSTSAAALASASPLPSSPSPLSLLSLAYWVGMISPSRLHALLSALFHTEHTSHRRKNERNSGNGCEPTPVDIFNSITDAAVLFHSQFVSEIEHGQEYQEQENAKSGKSFSQLLFSSCVAPEVLLSTSILYPSLLSTLLSSHTPVPHIHSLMPVLALTTPLCRQHTSRILMELLKQKKVALSFVWSHIAMLTTYALRKYVKIVVQIRDIYNHMSTKITDSSSLIEDEDDVFNSSSLLQLSSLKKDMYSIVQDTASLVDAVWYLSNTYPPLLAASHTRTQTQTQTQTQAQLVSNTACSAVTWTHVLSIATVTTLIHVQARLSATLVAHYQPQHAPDFGKVRNVWEAAMAAFGQDTGLGLSVMNGNIGKNVLPHMLPVPSVFQDTTTIGSATNSSKLPSSNVTVSISLCPLSLFSLYTRTIPTTVMSTEGIVRKLSSLYDGISILQHLYTSLNLPTPDPLPSSSSASPPSHALPLPSWARAAAASLYLIGMSHGDVAAATTQLLTNNANTASFSTSSSSSLAGDVIDPADMDTDISELSELSPSIVVNTKLVRALVAVDMAAADLLVLRSTIEKTTSSTTSSSLYSDEESLRSEPADSDEESLHSDRTSRRNAVGSSTTTVPRYTASLHACASVIIGGLQSLCSIASNPPSLAIHLLDTPSPSTTASPSSSSTAPSTSASIAASSASSAMYPPSSTALYGAVLARALPLLHLVLHSPVLAAFLALPLLDVAVEAADAVGMRVAKLCSGDGVAVGVGANVGMGLDDTPTTTATSASVVPVHCHTHAVACEACSLLALHAQLLKGRLSPAIQLITDVYTCILTAYNTPYEAAVQSDGDARGHGGVGAGVRHGHDVVVGGNTATQQREAYVLNSIYLLSSLSTLLSLHLAPSKALATSFFRLPLTLHTETASALCPLLTHAYLLFNAAAYTQIDLICTAFATARTKLDRITSATASISLLDTPALLPDVDLAVLSLPAPSYPSRLDRLLAALMTIPDRRAPVLLAAIYPYIQAILTGLAEADMGPRSVVDQQSGTVTAATGVPTGMGMSAAKPLSARTPSRTTPHRVRARMPAYASNTPAAFHAPGHIGAHTHAYSAGVSGSDSVSGLSTISTMPGMTGSMYARTPVRPKTPMSAARSLLMSARGVQTPGYPGYNSGTGSATGPGNFPSAACVAVVEKFLRRNGGGAVATIPTFIAAGDWSDDGASLSSTLTSSTSRSAAPASVRGALEAVVAKEGAHEGAPQIRQVLRVMGEVAMKRSKENSVNSGSAGVRGNSVTAIPLSFDEDDELNNSTTTSTTTSPASHRDNIRNGNDACLCRSNLPTSTSVPASTCSQPLSVEAACTGLRRAVVSLGVPAHITLVNYWREDTANTAERDESSSRSGVGVATWECVDVDEDDNATLRAIDLDIDLDAWEYATRYYSLPNLLFTPASDGEDESEEDEHVSGQLADLDANATGWEQVRVQHSVRSFALDVFGRVRAVVDAEQKAREEERERGRKLLLSSQRQDGRGGAAVDVEVEQAREGDSAGDIARLSATSTSHGLNIDIGTQHTSPEEEEEDEDGNLAPTSASVHSPLPSPTSATYVPVPPPLSPASNRSEERESTVTFSPAPAVARTVSEEREEESEEEREEEEQNAGSTATTTTAGTDTDVVVESVGNVASTPIDVNLSSDISSSPASTSITDMNTSVARRGADRDRERSDVEGDYSMFRVSSGDFTWWSGDVNTSMDRSMDRSMDVSVEVSVGENVSVGEGVPVDDGGDEDMIGDNDDNVGKDADNVDEDDDMLDASLDVPVEEDEDATSTQDTSLNTSSESLPSALTTTTTAACTTAASPSSSSSYSTSLFSAFRPTSAISLDVSSVTISTTISASPSSTPAHANIHATTSASSSSSEFFRSPRADVDIADGDGEAFEDAVDSTGAGAGVRETVLSTRSTTASFFRKHTNTSDNNANATIDAGADYDNVDDSFVDAVEASHITHTPANPTTSVSAQRVFTPERVGMSAPTPVERVLDAFAAVPMPVPSSLLGSALPVSVSASASMLDDSLNDSMGGYRTPVDVLSEAEDDAQAGAEADEVVSLDDALAKKSATTSTLRAAFNAKYTVLKRDDAHADALAEEEEEEDRGDDVIGMNGDIVFHNNPTASLPTTPLSPPTTTATTCSSSSSSSMFGLFDSLFSPLKDYVSARVQRIAADTIAVETTPIDDQSTETTPAPTPALTPTGSALAGEGGGVDAVDVDGVAEEDAEEAGAVDVDLGEEEDLEEDVDMEMSVEEDGDVEIDIEEDAEEDDVEMEEDEELEVEEDEAEEEVDEVDVGLYPKSTVRRLSLDGLDTDVISNTTNNTPTHAVDATTIDTAALEEEDAKAAASDVSIGDNTISSAAVDVAIEGDGDGDVAEQIDVEPTEVAAEAEATETATSTESSSATEATTLGDAAVETADEDAIATSVSTPIPVPAPAPARVLRATRASRLRDAAAVTPVEEAAEVQPQAEEETVVVAPARGKRASRLRSTLETSTMESATASVDSSALFAVDAATMDDVPTRRITRATRSRSTQVHDTEPIPVPVPAIATRATRSRSRATTITATTTTTTSIPATAPMIPDSISASVFDTDSTPITTRATRSRSRSQTTVAISEIPAPTRRSRRNSEDVLSGPTSASASAAASASQEQEEEEERQHGKGTVSRARRGRTALPAIAEEEEDDGVHVKEEPQKKKRRTAATTDADIDTTTTVTTASGKGRGGRGKANKKAHTEDEEAEEAIATMADEVEQTEERETAARGRGRKRTAATASTTTSDAGNTEDESNAKSGGSRKRSKKEEMSEVEDTTVPRRSTRRR